MSYIKINKMAIIIAIALALFPCYGLTWTAPIGIPTPSWPAEGIDQARPTLPNPWTSEQNGWYYVENISGCSDSRTRGYPGASRCSLPSSASAGSKIVLNGTLAGSKTISYTGSAGSEIWILGYNQQQKPVITADWQFAGSYLIIDSLSWSYTARDGNGLAGNHLLIRNCAYANPFDDSNGTAFAMYGNYQIFFNNIISQNGNWQYAGNTDIDRLGVKVFSGGNDVWIVDNKIYHCHSDAVQVGDQDNAPGEINRVYVGRNTAYENYQFGFWTKNATDVVFSQNVAYSMKTSSVSGNGGGMGGQYDPKYVWFLFNKIYDCNTGIFIVSSSSGGGGPWFAIGNVIYNIDAGNDCTAWNTGAMQFRNNGGFTAIHNTIYNVDSFFTTNSNAVGTITVRDNLFAQRIGNCRIHYAENKSPAMNYNMYSSNAWPVYYNSSSYTSISNFASGTGQEANRQVGDPLFVNASGGNFALQNGSQALNNANPTVEEAYLIFKNRYGVSIQFDFLGNSRPLGSWDIGAFESGSGAETESPQSPTGLKIVN